MTASARSVRRVPDVLDRAWHVSRRKRPLHAVCDVDLAIAEGRGAGARRRIRIGQVDARQDAARPLAARSAAASTWPARTSKRSGRRAHWRGASSRCSRIPYSSLNPRKTGGASIIALPLAVQGIGDCRGAARTGDCHALAGRALPPACRRLSERAFRAASASGWRSPAPWWSSRRSCCSTSRPRHSTSRCKSQILNLLLDLRRDLGLTYVFISHNLAVVEHVATRVAVMYLGRIVELADRAALFRTPRHPYTRALLDSACSRRSPGSACRKPGSASLFPIRSSPPSGCAFHPRCPLGGPRCRVEAPRVIEDAGGVIACHLHDGGVEMAK